MQKGGVGETTTSRGFGAEFAQVNVLLVTIDPQGKSRVESNSVGNQSMKRKYCITRYLPLHLPKASRSLLMKMFHETTKALIHLEHTVGELPLNSQTKQALAQPEQSIAIWYRALRARG